MEELQYIALFDIIAQRIQDDEIEIKKPMSNLDYSEISIRRDSENQTISIMKNVSIHKIFELQGLEIPSIIDYINLYLLEDVEIEDERQRKITRFTFSDEIIDGFKKIDKDLLKGKSKFKFNIQRSKKMKKIPHGLDFCKRANNIFNAIDLKIKATRFIFLIILRLSSHRQKKNMAIKSTQPLILMPWMKIRTSENSWSIREYPHPKKRKFLRIFSQEKSVTNS